ncbi:capsular polysaccharide biosynthesis protein [Alcaligenaceae bacterium LF4-65]|uniref:Capsular polysaccharide biosynthesis protein n=1 Tax=Zwartia hollandica TaxID=324606 RepID=A0A953T5K8_9BURK|nr:capsular polysaccharide biosynthesis protein [Zwartia hollandica]MBZ1351007.1 capsular polysaccharide biosynthesis protein [Zwartia hollandica]
MSARHHSYKKLGVFSRAIAKIADIETLLDAKLIPQSFGHFKEPIDAVAGWGHKPTADRARAYAKEKNLPYVAIEDGFLRSIGLGKDDPPLSVVIDDIGIYYDASQPSRLEQLAKVEITPREQERATALIALWREARVSKYNHLRETDHPLPIPYILVVDQTLGDASVTLGQADASSFETMLAAALAEHPNKTILIKTHPEVLAGHKKGFFDLTKLQSEPRIQVWPHDCHPVSLIEQAETVYTVTSQLGFEALLWGKTVHVFGMPFYAGWGLTKDRLPPPTTEGIARRRAISLTQLAYAALIAYPRYRDPETSAPCSVEELIAWMERQRALRQQFAPTVYGLDFSWNKRPNVRRFLSGSDIKFVSKEASVPAGATLAVWGSRPVTRTDLKVLRIEDGFIRSVGLGAAYARPLSWVMDSSGIYYDATQPSDLENILQTFEPTPELLARAKKLREQIVSTGITKYNLNSKKDWYRPSTAQKVLLVIGQVETDASIAKGATTIRTNIELLQQVRKLNPGAFLVYKPHPDVVAKLRKQGVQEDKAKLYCNSIVADTSLDAILNKVDEVHVITSLSGFEALLREVPVVTYGCPFYAGWGLTHDHTQIERRKRKRSLDELVAAALILYPRYWLLRQRSLVQVEAAVHKLQQPHRDENLLTKVKAYIFQQIDRYT